MSVLSAGCLQRSLQAWAGIRKGRDDQVSDSEVAFLTKLLSRQVTAMLMGALESGSDALIGYVFETAHVLSWLVEAPTEVNPPPRADGGAADAPLRQPLRAGALTLNPYCKPFNLMSAHLPPSA